MTFVYHGFTHDIAWRLICLPFLKRKCPQVFSQTASLNWSEFMIEDLRLLTKTLSFPGLSAKWAIPYLRRAMTEVRIKRVAKDHGLKYTERKNSKGNWGGNCPQVEIELGLFKLLFHAVDSPSRKVRRSRRRESLASRQRLLFSLTELHPDLGEGQIFGVILHGPDSPKPGESYENLSRVGFVSLGFLLQNLITYIRPLTLLNTVIWTYIPKPKTEPSEDKAHPELRKEIKIKKKN